MRDHAVHWEGVWAAKQPNETSWFQESPEPCSHLVRDLSDPTSHVAIIGAGVSRLVDNLVIDHGYKNLEAVDISTAALDRLRDRLGPDASAVRLRECDVRLLGFDEPLDLWHDRAVFHFLTDPADRDAYVSRSKPAVRSGGFLVIATFALDGPEQCSGLPVVRYDALSLAAEFGPGFELVDQLDHEHVTPWGSTQPFTYAVLRRASVI